MDTIHKEIRCTPPAVKEHILRPDKAKVMSVLN